MLKVFIHPTFIPEKTYTIDFILHTFLGIPYQIIPASQSQHTILQGEQDWQIVLEDHFFHQSTEPCGYIDRSFIPESVSRCSNRFIPEYDIPVLFGNRRCTVTGKKIHCGIDLIATVFFMLTRWEECLPDSPLDAHRRFSAESSLAYRFQFLDRPIVNEHIEMLWNMITHFSPDRQRREKRFRPILTHDVDGIHCWDSRFQFLVNLVGDLLKRRSVRAFNTSLKRFLSRFETHSSIFETFSWLMDLSETLGEQSYFFFHPGRGSPPDPAYRLNSPLLQSILEWIIKRGHIIGFHAGYQTYLDSRAWISEKSRLDKNLPHPTTEGRQHFLRFRVPDTWQIWEDHRMVADSTCGYADHEGYRCGTSDFFPVFNVSTRRQLNLIEKPLVIMDATLINYRKYTASQCSERLTQFIDKARKYRMPITLLFHQQNMYPSEASVNWRKLLSDLFAGNDNSIDPFPGR